ncbi:MAG: hypothetical protein IJ057_06295 [Bacteroidales bacterium]|nr:hypothetical protein [Bacteroidales bacterium]
MNKSELEKEINEALLNAIVNRNAEDTVAGINGLPHTIDWGDYYYVPYVVRTDHEITFSDSYIAMYGRRTKYGISTNNYLFLVTSNKAEEVIDKFLTAYNELAKRKLIRNRQWNCPYKGLKLMVSAKDIKGSKWLNDL